MPGSVIVGGARTPDRQAVMCVEVVRGDGSGWVRDQGRVGALGDQR